MTTQQDPRKHDHQRRNETSMSKASKSITLEHATGRKGNYKKESSLDHSEDTTRKTTADLKAMKDNQTKVKINLQTEKMSKPRQQEEPFPITTRRNDSCSTT